jgi:predicted Zn-dependent protease
MLKKKTGQLDLAERELVSALLNEKNERQIYLEGLYRVYKEQKKWLAAEKTIRQLIAIKPKDLALTVELAEVFYEQGLESLLELKSVLPETTWVTQGIDQIDEILTRLRGD